MPEWRSILVINEVKSDLGISMANELIDEFDLELQYNIAPIEPGLLQQLSHATA